MVVHIKPISGVLVRDPRTKQAIPESGKSVNLDTYWLRRIRDKTVFIVEEKVAEKLSASDESGEHAKNEFDKRRKKE